MARDNLIGERGVAFIRRAEGRGFNAACEEIVKQSPKTEGISLPDRRHHPFMRPAANLVSSHESSSRVGLAHVSGQLAVISVLEAVPELLRPYVGLDTIVFNRIDVRHNRAGTHFLKLYAEDDDRLENERTSVIEALNELAPGCNMNWPYRVPDLALATTDSEVSERDVKLVRTVVESMLPLEAELSKVHTVPKLPPVQR